MSRIRVGHNLYQDEKGFIARIWTTAKRRSWRRLKAKNLKYAKAEASKAAWSAKADRFGKLADAYLEAGCPNSRLESRPETFCSGEARRMVHVREFFSRFAPDEIRPPILHEYKKFRIKRMKREGTGERATDMDIQTLSNCLTWGVNSGTVAFNYIRSGRPRFRKFNDVVHSRERAPSSVQQIHKILDSLFRDVRSEACGWQAAFAYLTGCRSSELLRLRMDARKGEPGYVEGSHLHLGRRSKSGVNPFVLLTPELADCLLHHRRWHSARYPKNPYYFPSRLIGSQDPLDPGSLSHSMTSVCHALKINPTVTPHGLRSFYVTVRRSLGASDSQVAAEIGDKTVALIQRTYGDIPANWTGGQKMSWVPEGTGDEKRRPAWQLV